MLRGRHSRGVWPEKLSHQLTYLAAKLSPDKWRSVKPPIVTMRVLIALSSPAHPASNGCLALVALVIAR